MIDDRAHPPGCWIVTAEQLVRGYHRRAPDGTRTGPFPYVVLHGLPDGTFAVDLPPDDAEEETA